VWAIPIAARGLNFAGDQWTRVLARSKSGITSRVSENISEGEEEVMGGGLPADGEDQSTTNKDVVSNVLAKGVEDLNVRGMKRKEGVADSWRDMKERVSFGTNLSTDKDSFKEEAQEVIKTPNTLATKRFLAHKKEGKGVQAPGRFPPPRRSIEKPLKRKAILKKVLGISV
jgi:hypothetical protein